MCNHARSYLAVEPVFCVEPVVSDQAAERPCVIAAYITDMCAGTRARHSHTRDSHAQAKQVSKAKVSDKVLCADAAYTYELARHSLHL